MEEQDSLKILLADDHRIVCDGLRSLLEREPDMEVIAEAHDGRSAVSLARELRPDVVVMDVGMPDLNGIEAARKISAARRDVKLIALSMHSDKRFVAGMLRAGAAAYVLKECAFEELAAAIRAVTAGRTYLSPAVADLLVGDYLRRLSSKDGLAPELTPREREVLQLIAEGHTTKAIAERLGVSVKTVDTHRQNMMRRLGMHTVAELTKYAVREGLTELER